MRKSMDEAMSENRMIDKKFCAARQMARGGILAAFFWLVVGMTAEAQAATRFYLENVAAAVTPATRGVWSNSTGTTNIQMSRNKSGAIASNGLAETSTSNTYDRMLLKVVSEPIQAQTISGTVDWVIGARQSSTFMNAFWAAHIYVVSSDGSTLRGTLLDNAAENTTNEWGANTTTAQGWGTQGPKTLTAVTAQAGDRIIVEIGYIARNTNNTSYTGTLWYGGTGSDLTVGGDQATAVGWIEFSSVDFCTSTTGDVTVTGGSVNGPSINVCSMHNLGGNTLSNITIKNGATAYYNGGSCGNIPTTAAGGAPIDWLDGTLDLTVTATDDCSATKQGAGTFNFSTCVPTDGPFEVIEDGMLSGISTDATTVLNADAAFTFTNIKVYEVTGTGTDINKRESFDDGGVEGWGAEWKATGADGVALQASPPANGDLTTGFFTRSEGTGPGDTPSGEFLYYEASVGAGTDRYLVHTPIYDAANNHLSLAFKYNMHGADVGTLAVQARRNGGPWVTEWSQSGNQSDVWKTGTVDLYGGTGLSGTAYTSGTVEVRFRFTYGGGPLGDIALDEAKILGPRGTGSLLFDGNPTQAQNSSTDGSGSFPQWPEGTIKIEAAGSDDCGGALSTYGFASFIADYIDPVVDIFAMPASSLAPITVYSLSASDNLGIAGYLITESPTPPAAGAPGWSSTAPVKVTPSTTGTTMTFYAWAKDLAGNISAPLSQTVQVLADTEAPAITAFDLPASSFSPVSVISFAVHDNSGTVTGYMITETAVAPLPTAADWLAAPPAKVTTATIGSATFYAWAKDGAGNVSAATSRTVQMKVDNTAPIVSFEMPGTASSTVVPVTLFTAVDNIPDAASNTGVTGYLITESTTAPNAADPRWRGAPSLEATASSDGVVTFYAWAKDAAGNVSTPVSQSVTITLPASCDYDIASGATGAAAATYINAENFTNATAPNPWVMDVGTTPLADNSGDYSDGGYLVTTNGGTGTTPRGSRHDYPVNFTTGGTYCIWVRALDQAGAGGGDSIFWGVDGNAIGAMTQNADNQWAWSNGVQSGSRCTTIAVGPHTINLWPREAGQKVDAFVITRDSSSTAGIFSGNNDLTTTRTTLEAAGVKVTVDPSCVTSGGGGGPGGGGGSGYIYIPDGQSIAGNPIDPEALYETDLGATGRLYRTLGAASDGFNGSALDAKWFRSFVGNQTAAEPSIVPVGGHNMVRVYGRGTNIWGTSDQFTYLYQPNLRGNFTVEVLVNSLTNTNSYAKAGVMVRQSLANNSAHAMALLTGSNGVGFYRRPTSGGNSQNSLVGSSNGPVWVRLVRSGNQFSAYYATPANSAGNNWIQIGPTQTINMTDPVNVGLAVTSTNTRATATGIFDNFLFMPAGVSGMNPNWAPTPPASINTTGWTDGTYALSVRSVAADPDVEPETNTLDFSSCVDATPSTVTVRSGSVVGGRSASLAGLFDHTGNANNFRYQVDGVDVSPPWNSYSQVPDGTARNVTLRVIGIDPDCGGSTIADSGIITVDNTCSDPDPSTITILTGQTVGGPNVDLRKLFTHTGDVGIGGFSYKIDGQTIGDPTAWDSRAYGIGQAQTVTLEISGIDPDCGIQVTGYNMIEVDNRCVRNPPSLSFADERYHVGAGRNAPIQVTIRNEDSFNCGPSTFNVNLFGTSNNVDFDLPYFFPAGSNASITLQGRQEKQLTLVVPAKAETDPPTREWKTNLTTLDVTSNLGGTAHLDLVTGEPPQKGVETVIFLVSPISHNSVTTHSYKWGGSPATGALGTWGTSAPASKYGNFTCLTCHSKTGPNIKWMRGSIATPDGSSWGISSQKSLPIMLQDAQPGSPDWGNDDPAGDGSGRLDSNRACEICHSTTMYHRYDTNTDPDPLLDVSVGPQTDLNHFNGRNCIDCHRHSLGFTADCTGCHGNPPLEASLGGPTGLADIPGITGSITPGTHYKHSMVLNYPCEYCHAGWRIPGEMPKEVDGQYQINHRFNVFYDLGMTDPVKDNGHYTGQDGVNYEPYQPAIDAGDQFPGGTIPPGKGSMTCENIYCHGGTESMGGSNPQWNGNIACNSCHGTSATNTPPGYSHSTHVGKMGMPCTDCHYTAGRQAGFNGHVNGRVNMELSVPGYQGGTPRYDPDGPAGPLPPVVSWNSNPNGDDMPPSSQYGTCQNVACHYGNETPVWNNDDRPADCTTCHNNGAKDGDLGHAAPASGSHNQHLDATPGSINEKMLASFINVCESCHGGGSNAGHHPGHLNGEVDLGGGMTFSHGNQTCTSQCHDLQGVDGSGNPVAVTWGSSHDLACQSCHAAPYLGPTVIDPDAEGIGINVPAGGDKYGSHLKATAGETFNAGTNWTAQCRKCHPYHASEAGIIVATVPQPDSAWDQLGDGTDMAYKLGLQFPVTGGIHLGGTATTKATEAEICWECHDANGISEWGENNNSLTGGLSYNYGTLNTSNWVSAIWTSGTAPFSYKTAAVQSTHAAAVSTGAGITSRSGRDDVGAIRCTYCHDVHDMNRALADHNAGTYETLTGAPYLRGTWLGNPYKEDGAPQAGTTYTNFSSDRYGAVPRGSSEPNQLMGGYWIDQNSGNPVNGKTYDDFGGICQLCHGADVNTLNQYGADDGAGWISGYNGHANAVMGGAGGGGLAARNIFNDTDRGGGSTSGYNGSMAYWGFQEPGDDNAGIRGNDGDAWGVQPYVDSASDEPCANDGGSCNGNYSVAWDDLSPLTVRGTSSGSPDNSYHTFSCSKCHNPHASRLPKLMITNCLDTKQNKWDNNYQVGTSGPAVLDNTSASNWTTAQNCHRLAGNDPQDTNDAAGGGAGWNRVTPWTDTDGYGSGAAPTQDNIGTW